MAYTDEDKGLGECDLCGDWFDLNSSTPSRAEVGEFVRDRTEHDAEGSVAIIEHVIAHAQCGIDHGLEMA